MRLIAIQLALTAVLSTACASQQPLSGSHRHGSAPAAKAGFRVSPNVRVAPAEHNECWAAAAPTDARLLIAACQNGPELSVEIPRSATSYLSHDGGLSWSAISLPKLPDGQGGFDPQVATGPDGTLHVMYGLGGIDMPGKLSKAGHSERSTIWVWSSADAGQTWSDPVPLRCPSRPDHPRIHVAQHGPYRGHVFISWNDVLDSRIYLHVSTDRGTSFTAAKRVATGDATHKYVATDPVALSDGTVLVSFFQYRMPLTHPEGAEFAMFVVRSTDGGKSFGPHEQVMLFGPHIWRTKMDEFLGAFTNPMMIVDHHASSPHRDRIFLVWDDVSDGSADIWLSSSDDRGKSWTAPVRVNAEIRPQPGEPLDYRSTPAVAVNPRGQIGVAWYDRRDDIAHMCWRYMMSVSDDGGRNFGPDFAVASAPSCPDAALAPLAKVYNRTPGSSQALPAEALARMDELQRLIHEYQKHAHALHDQVRATFHKATLVVTANNGRALWPGHYTGLAASADGRFHPLWLDRREGRQLLYTAQVDAGTDPGTAPAERDVSGVIELIATGVEDVGSLIPMTRAERVAADRVALSLAVKNVSGHAIFGPIRLRSASSDLAMKVADGGGDVTFWAQLGSDGVLRPGETSEPLRVTLPIDPQRFADRAFSFDIVGRTSR